MTVVSNASPLISLARIGQLDLLRMLFDELRQRVYRVDVGPLGARVMYSIRHGLAER